MQSAQKGERGSIAPKDPPPQPATMKYHSTYDCTIKMKPVHVNSSTYIDFNKEINKEDPKSEVGHSLKHF